MMKKTVCVFIFCLFFIIPAEAGNESVIMPALYTSAGARAAGMGGAFTAVSEDVSSLYWNPAGLGSVIRPEFSLSHEIWLVDASINRLSAAVPLPAGTVGAEILYLAYGAFELSDSNGTVLEGTLSPYDAVISAAYGINLMKTLSGGITLKYASRSDGINETSHFMADAGFRYSDGTFSAALGLRNFGPAENYSLPYVIRAGAGYAAVPAEGYKILLAADAAYMFDSGIELNAGAEFSMTNFIFVRAGYRSSESNSALGGLSGLTAGFGLHFEMFEADYEFVPYGDLGTAHRIEVKVKIGPDPLRSVRTRRQPDGKMVTRDELQKLYDIAYGYEAKNELKTAEEAYLKLLSLAPEYSEALKRLGAVYVKMNKTDEAVKIFERYLKLKPGDKAVEKWLKNNRPW